LWGTSRTCSAAERDLTEASVALGRIGFLKGKNAPPDKAATSAQLAAVIVDSSSLDRLTAAAETINVTLLEIVAAGKTSARATSAAARSSKDADRSIQQLSEAIDRLHGNDVSPAREKLRRVSGRARGRSSQCMSA
jgi:hypothetical protein